MQRNNCENLSRVASEVVQKEILAERGGLPQYEGWRELIAAERLRGNRMGFPWDEWAPGALNKHQMEKLLKRGYITFSGSTPKLGHSSMDLSLGDDVFEMLDG